VTPRRPPRRSRESAPPLRVRGPTPQEEADKAELLARVEADRADLLFRYPFLARLSMHLKVVPTVDFRVPTAATDGHSVWLNPSFLGMLTDDERRFVLAHEVWHCALGHVGPRKEGRSDEGRWNEAVDHEVNSMLEAEGLALPRGAVLFREWTGRPAEEVYELLGAALDSRSMREEHPCGPLGEPEQPRKPLDRGRLADVHAIPEAEDALAEAWAASVDAELTVDPSFRPAPPPPPESWEDRLLLAAQQAPEAAAALGEALRTRLDALRAPTVPWRAALRRFVTSAFGGERRWLPPNRRHLAAGLYLPSRRAEQLNAVVAVDTSGSTQLLLADFASELVGLLDSFGRYGVTLICCDAEIRSVRQFDAERPLRPEDLWFDGGCGTDFRPVFEWLENEGSDASVLLFLTDGQGPAPERGPALPVLWVLNPRGEAPANWGEVLRLG
jgi:predicted metal-dependent peptidase